MKNIFVPISPGELLDKITILEIKTEQIENPDKLSNVKTELQFLQEVWSNSEITTDQTLDQLKLELKLNNKELWDIEDKIRIKEANKEFDQEFIELARSVYVQNDKRATTKRKINEKLGSNIIEEKSYAEY